MAYEDLETIVIDFDDFRSSYQFSQVESEPVFVELDGLTGIQHGDVHPMSEYFEGLPPRYIPISTFYNREYEISRRESRERLLSDSVEARELPEDELEERVTEFHREVLINWWGDMLLQTVTLDGHEVTVEWVDGDDELYLYQYFDDLDLEGVEI